MATSVAFQAVDEVWQLAAGGAIAQASRLPAIASAQAATPMAAIRQSGATANLAIDGGVRISRASLPTHPRGA